MATVIGNRHNYTSADVQAALFDATTGARGIESLVQYIVRKEIPANTFYGQLNSGKYVPLYPIAVVSSVSTNDITVDNASNAALFDPTDEDANDTWVDNAYVCYFDANTGETECTADDDSTKVKVSSVSSNVITNNGALTIKGGSADPAADDLIIPGNWDDGETINDIVFCTETVRIPENTTSGDVVALTAYRDGEINYDKLPAHSKNFIDVVLANSSATRAAFISRFRVTGR